MKKATAIITARGGSKGVPRKNIREVCGKPLIAYTIEAALGCSLVDDCYVTTDDEEISRISENWGAEIIKRPDQLASDTAKSQDVVLHALDFLKKNGNLPEYFVLLQPTSPLRNSIHLTKCLGSFFSDNAICSSSVTEASHHPYKTLIASKDGLRPIRETWMLEHPRQLLPKAYRINGAIYAMRTDVFRRKKVFFVKPYLPFIMTRIDSLDIDTEDDLKALADIIISRRIVDISSQA
jgi:CMP-N,N'-diacetyllegionaminic acid synthase